MALARVDNTPAPLGPLLARLLSPLARAEAERTWPPEVVREHWEEVEDYARRYENKRERMLMYTPEFSRSAYYRAMFTPAAIAREVCNFSADMLFSAPPDIKFEKNEELLKSILDENKLDSALIDFAGKCAAEGRAGLRIYYDAKVNEMRTPLIDHVHESEVIWNERGRFVTGGAIIIDREVKAVGAAANTVYRLVEEHTPGEVFRRLFKGNDQKLGDRVGIDTLREFAGLPEHEDTQLDTPTLIRWDNVPGGYSDLAGATAMLDAINAEISYGRAKSEKSQPVAFADSSLFDDNGRVDVSSIVPTKTSGRYRELGVEPEMLYGVIQPDFTSAEVIAWIDFLLDTCLLSMGYSKASYGRDEGGSADSGKALSMRQARTLLKKAGKDRMAIDAIGTAVAVALAWQDNARRVNDYLPDVQLGDGLPRDTMEDAQEANAWGDSISLEEKIRMRRPDWDDDEIQEEVERLNSRAPAAAPTVPSLGGLAGVGLAASDAERAVDTTSLGAQGRFRRRPDNER